jgi:hypothetical protein
MLLLLGGRRSLASTISDMEMAEWMGQAVNALSGRPILGAVVIGSGVIVSWKGEQCPSGRREIRSLLGTTLFGTPRLVPNTAAGSEDAGPADSTANKRQ